MDNWLNRWCSSNFEDFYNFTVIKIFLTCLSLSFHCTESSKFYAREKKTFNLWHTINVIPIKLDKMCIFFSISFLLLFFYLHLFNLGLLCFVKAAITMLLLIASPWLLYDTQWSQALYSFSSCPWTLDIYFFDQRVGHVWVGKGGKGWAYRWMAVHS